jgi:hypothetical protein
MTGFPVRPLHYELEAALRVGFERNEFHQRRRNDPEPLATRRLSYDIAAATSELVVSKVNNEYWHASIDVRHTAVDVGERTQVRWTSHPKGDLLVREDDADDHIYYLVTGMFVTRGSSYFYVNNTMFIMGSVEGHKAKNPYWRSSINNSQPLYCVPQWYLNPVTSSKLPLDGPLAPLPGVGMGLKWSHIYSHTRI